MGRGQMFENKILKLDLLVKIYLLNKDLVLEKT